MTEPLSNQPHTGVPHSTPSAAKHGVLGSDLGGTLGTAGNEHKVTVVAFRKHNAVTKKLISSFRSIAAVISSRFATTKAYDDSKTSAKPPSTIAKAVRNIWDNLMYEKVQVISGQSVTTELRRFDIAEKVNNQKLGEDTFSQEFFTKIVDTFDESDFEPLCTLLENRVLPYFQVPHTALAQPSVEAYFKLNSDKAVELYNRTKHNFQNDELYSDYFMEIVKPKTKGL